MVGSVSGYHGAEKMRDLLSAAQRITHSAPLSHNQPRFSTQMQTHTDTIARCCSAKHRQRVNEEYTNMIAINYSSFSHTQAIQPSNIAARRSLSTAARMQASD